MSIEIQFFKIRFTDLIQIFLFFQFYRLCGLLLNCLLLIFGAKLSVAKSFYYRIGKAKLIDKCQNAIKCQNACTSGLCHASEFFFITL